MEQGCRVLQLGKTTAIICGGEPTDHKCDAKKTVYEFSDGFRGTLFDKARKEKLNLDMCDDDKMYFLLERGIDLRAGSVACSICGRAAIDNIVRCTE
jgi:hypothetical protein